MQVDYNSQPPEIDIVWYNGISQQDLSIVANTGNYGAVPYQTTYTLYNLVQVFYSAIRLDVGHWTPNNILTNLTAFNQTLVPAGPFVESALSESNVLAYTNLTSPPAADVATPPAVIQIQYTCNIQKYKTLGSLFMSVAAATLSMFL
ncbi:uncharacterized protein FIBRA_07094 [Fibroporia radiculosa]|uniref:Uncharacterized protein n=1 Tax=Fibroporia radiculosa TaxID=599839 RepID=J4GDG5_9APHY|nr:uncharacterized protein FIBRA_07094 [Fibroporia radiculosa]CCM04898.1 predicted protein [Fibroporia radiculosa]